MKHNKVPFASPPPIKPCEEVDRPLWSVMIPVYNCAHFLPQTLDSVLKQDPGEKLMQIEVVDDASTDADVAAIVRNAAGKRVQYYRQASNVGSLANFVSCLNRSKGHYVHLLHGDDRVRKGYYREMELLFNQYPDIGAAFCRFSYINEKGELLFNHDKEIPERKVLDNWLLRIAERQRVQYCAMAVKRKVYEHLGGFYGVSYGEDWEMWARIAAHYQIAYTPTVLAEYRIHMNSVSGRSFQNGKNMQDLRWVIDTIGNYVLPEQRKAIQKKTHRFYAHYGLRIANRLWHTSKNRKQTKIQIKQALKMHRDAGLYWKVIKLNLKMLMGIS